MRNYILLLLIVSFAITSCDKNQKLISDIEGEWSIDTYMKDSVDYKVESGKLEFESCENDAGDCEGEFYLLAQYTEQNGSFEVIKEIDEVASFDYSVTESGNEMFITFTDVNTGYLTTYEFDVDYSEGSLDLNSVDGSYEISLDRKK